MTGDELMDGRQRAASDPTGAYRAIRRVGQPEAPLAGELVAAGAGVVMLVDAAQLVGWGGWAHGGAQHVLAPVDIVGRPDGLGVVLPRCRLALDSWLAAAERRPIPGGEAVTVAVSLLRGTQEAWRGVRGDEDGPAGAWWITADGRPLVALGGGEPVETAAVRSLERLGAACADRVLERVLGDACAALRRPRSLRRVVEELEERLFAACAPRPLAFAERPVDDERREPTDASTLPSRRTDPSARVRSRRAPETWSIVEGLMDAPLLGMAVSALEAIRERAILVRRRASTPAQSRAARRRSHRAPLLLGAAIAALVVLGGVLWPGDGNGGAAGSAGATGGGQTQTASATQRPAGSASPPPSSTAEPDPEESPESATARLVPEAAGAEAVLLDDFGDVAVTRVEQAEEVLHVVLERIDGDWVLREVYRSPGAAVHDEGAG